MKVSFAKLRAGGWGLRIKVGKGESVSIGDTVTVEKRDGSTDEAIVGRIIWSTDEADGGKTALTYIARERSIAA